MPKSTNWKMYPGGWLDAFLTMQDKERIEVQFPTYKEAQDYAFSVLAFKRGIIKAAARLHTNLANHDWTEEDRKVERLARLFATVSIGASPKTCAVKIENKLLVSKDDPILQALMFGRSGETLTVEEAQARSDADAEAMLQRIMNGEPPPAPVAPAAPDPAEGLSDEARARVNRFLGGD